MTGVFDLQRFAGLLTTRAIGRRLDYHQSVDTTMRLAREAAVRDVAHGTLILAEEQTAGVGRRGRSFQSPRGENLYFTLILRLDPAQHRRLPVAVPAAVCAAIRAAGADVAIKWPNDIWAAGLKVCGMLIDAESGPAGLVAYPGIGINVNGDPSAIRELREVATSVRNLTRVHVDREALLANICNGLDAYLDGEAAQLADDYRRLSMVIGRDVVLTFADGRVAPARAESVADDGTLLVVLADGRREEVTAAEVSLRPA